MADTNEKFSSLSVLLHWGIAIAFIGMIAFGLYLEDLPRGPDKSALMPIHFMVGLGILGVALIRFLWRLTQGFPAPAGPMKGWEKALANTVIWGLLAATLLMPLSGMMMVLGNGHPLDVFGLFTVGPFTKTEAVAGAGHFIHGVGSKLVIAFIALHFAGAMKHHFVAKDGTLVRMFGKRIKPA